jgi:rSAM/selenodomain-associated transferase 1
VPPIPYDPYQISSNVLIVVAKRPAPGQTKTRLSPPLSPEQASTLYECFLRDTLDLMRQVQGVKRAIAYLPEDERHYFSDLAPDFWLLRQDGLDLGSRLDNALSHYLRMGCRNAVIMDSDSPNLPASCLILAFAMLEDGADAVIGPCDDGGYYLIGLKRPCPRLLREVRMSTPNVTADTLAVAAEENLQVGLLPAWHDVDDHRSLRRLFAELTVAPDSVARSTREYLAKLSFQGLFAPSPEEPISSRSSQGPPFIR